MDNCVAKSLITKKNKHFVISNIVDEKVFKKIDKKSARSILNIDSASQARTEQCRGGSQKDF